MTSKTKIVLSDKDISAAGDADWILTKRRVMDAACDILGACVPLCDSYFLSHPDFPKEASVRHPKISKGENYLQLPYAILDHPRFFSDDSILAVRTMFWWAHFFSITLQVSGRFLPAVEKALLISHSSADVPVFFCINKDPWQHHFENDNYVPLNLLSRDDILAQINQAGFIKLAVQYELGNWSRMPQLLEEGYQILARYIG